MRNSHDMGIKFVRNNSKSNSPIHKKRTKCHNQWGFAPEMYGYLPLEK